MKRFFPQFRNLFACVAVLLFSAMFWTETASAQSIVLKPLNDDWMSVNDATTTLKVEISNMDAQLQNAYNESLDYKRKFYNGIVISLEEGDGVPDAINENIIKFVPGISDAAIEVPNPLSVAVWQGYYDEVNLLLQN